MRLIYKLLSVTTLIAALLGGFAIAAGADVARGRQLAHDVMKGNCLACHQIPADPRAVTAATIGPPLIGMRVRFPDSDRLRRQISDPIAANPNTVMPPFGRHRILEEDEIDAIIDYLYTQ